MFFKPLMSGVSMGLTVGTLVFTLARSTAKQKKKLKTRAGKALDSLKELVNGLSQMLG